MKSKLIIIFIVSLLLTLGTSFIRRHNDPGCCDQFVTDTVGFPIPIESTSSGGIAGMIYHHVNPYAYLMNFIIYLALTFIIAIPIYKFAGRK